MVAESRPRPIVRPELTVSADTHQRITDALVKRFATLDARTGAYQPVITDLNAPVEAVPPPYEGEPSEVWDGSRWRGIDVWTGRAWKPLRQPFTGGEGLITVEIDDAEEVVPEPGVGEGRRYLQFTVTLVGIPQEKVSVDFLSEERDPRSVADRARRNPDGTDAIPNPDPGGAQLDVDFADVHGTLVFDPADRAGDDFGNQIRLGDGRAAFLSNPQRLRVEVYPDIDAGEGVERMQMRLERAIRCRIDRPIGIGIIASSQQPVVRIYDTSVDTEHAPAVAGQPRQIRPTTANFRVEIVKNAVAATKPITFTVRTNDITATAGVDYRPLDGARFTIPVGTTAINVPVIIPAQPTEGNERFGITLGNLSSEAVFATQYAECEIRGTPAFPLFYAEFVDYGALFSEPESDIISIPWYVIPRPTGTTVIEYWTYELSRIGRVADNALDYEVITEANRRTLTVTPSNTSGIITLSAYLFRIRRRQLEQDRADAAAGRPVPSRPEVDIVFALRARRRSGNNLAGIDNDTAGSGARVGQVSLGLESTTGVTATPTIRISPGRPRTGTETEGDQTSENIQARFPISISFAPTRAITITAATSTGGAFGTAEAFVDYVPKTQAIQWGIGDNVLTKYFDVDIVEDTLAEPDETFSAIISNVRPSGAAEITTARATYTIQGETAPGQPTPPPGVSIASAQVERPLTGTVRQLTFPITITRAPSAGRTGSVDVQVVAASARANQHYQTAPNTAAGFAGTATRINWASGDAAGKVVNVLILGGDNLTRPVFFLVRLTNPAGVTIQQAEARGAILARPETETPTGPGPVGPTRQLPTVTIGDSQPPEDHSRGYLLFPVTLSRQLATGETASVDYITQGLEATAGTDYDLRTQQQSGVTQTRATSRELQGQVEWSGSITSREIRVNVINDDVVETNERMLVLLSNPVGCRIEDNQAVGTIHNDDQPPVVQQRPAVTISRVVRSGNNVIFTISTTRAISTAITGEFSTTAGTAVASTDYNPVGKELSGVTRGRRWTIRANALSTTQTVTLIEGSGAASRRSFTGYIENISSNATLGTARRRTFFIPARQVVDPGTSTASQVTITGTSPTARGGNAVVRITRSGNVTQPGSVTLGISPVGTTTIGSASNTDLASFRRIVSLGRNTRNVTINIPTRVPTTDQPLEQFDAFIGAPITGPGLSLGSTTRTRLNLPAYTTPSLIGFLYPVISIRSWSDATRRGFQLLFSYPVLLTRRLTRPVSFNYTASWGYINREERQTETGLASITPGTLGGALNVGNVGYFNFNIPITLTQAATIIGALIAGLATAGLAIGSVATLVTAGTGTAALPAVTIGTGGTALITWTGAIGTMSVVLPGAGAFLAGAGLGAAALGGAAFTFTQEGGGLSFISSAIADSNIIAVERSLIAAASRRSILEEINVLVGRDTSNLYAQNSGIYSQLVVSNIRGPVENRANLTIRTEF